MSISQLILTHKNIKGSMGQWYPYSKKWEKITVAILRIHGDRGIFILFYDDQDTASE